MTEPKTDRQTAGLMEIDLDAVLKNKLPAYHRFIPRPLIRLLEKMICQDSLNEMLRVNRGRRDADFCRGVIDHLGISYSVNNSENLPDNPRAIFVCNHPLGGLDGMILIDMLTQRYGPGLKFIVNDLLMAIEPLSGVFLPVNKHGRQNRQALEAIDNAFKSQAPVMIFPAGLVSRKSGNGTIADLEWKKMFVNKAIASRRDIIPMHFSGHNSKFFYNFAKIRTRLRIGFNIEMIRLPAEVFRCRGRHFSVTVGQTIPWNTLRGGAEAENQALEIRRISDSLGESQTAGPKT